MSFVDKPYEKLDPERPRLHLFSGILDFTEALTSNQKKLDAILTTRPDQVKCVHMLLKSKDSYTSASLVF